MPPPQQHLSTSSAEVFVIQLNKVASTGKTALATSAWRARVGAVEGLRLHFAHRWHKWICIGLHTSGDVGIRFCHKSSEQTIP